LDYSSDLTFLKNVSFAEVHVKLLEVIFQIKHVSEKFLDFQERSENLFEVVMGKVRISVFPIKLHALLNSRSQLYEF